MSAPEKIWATVDPACDADGVFYGDWYDDGVSGVEYIRQDLHDAALAAARAEAMREGMLKAAALLEAYLFWAPVLPDAETKAWVDGSKVTATTAAAAIRAATQDTARAGS